MKFMTGEWFKAAEMDLMTIEEIKDNEHLTTIIAFHAQQCIEKVFKAVIEEYDLGEHRIHSLIKLRAVIANILPLPFDEDTLGLINQLYIESRYPGDLGLLPTGRPTCKQAKVFYTTAQQIYDDVKQFFENNPQGE
ncbi:MAG: HEPN domain-containing protein [Campylobacterales bacterium]|nr:HEPN domain-containing protein [Campylobacterales bacterium]